MMGIAPLNPSYALRTTCLLKEEVKNFKDAVQFLTGFYEINVEVLHYFHRRDTFDRPYYRPSSLFSGGLRKRACKHICVPPEPPQEGQHVATGLAKDETAEPNYTSRSLPLKPSLEPCARHIVLCSLSIAQPRTQYC
jgi:hypothetical protein